MQCGVLKQKKGLDEEQNNKFRLVSLPLCQ